jgi:Sec-independent protein translocase protein TatA
MDILGIGPLELIFIIIIALIVLGPSDMVKAGRTIGKFLRQVVTSPTWRAVTRTSDELRTLPNKLIRDAGLEEDFKEIQEATKKAVPPNFKSDISKWQEDINTWTTPPSIGKSPPDNEAPSNNPSSTSEDQIEEEES